MKNNFTHLENLKYLTIEKIQQYPEWSLLKQYYDAGINNPRQLIYHALHNLDSIPSCKCGNNLSWNSDKREYRKFCSKRCTAIFSIEKIKEKNLSAIGVEWHSQTQKWAAKIKETSLNKFGVDHYSQTEEFRNRVKQTNIKKFGVEYPAQSNIIQEKIKDKFTQTYGVSNPLLDKSIQKHIAATNIQKYGVINPLSNFSIQDKVKQTNLLKYQTEYPMKNSEVSKKAGIIRKEKYYSPEILSKLNDPRWLQEQNQLLTVSEISKLLGVSSSNLCKYFNRYNIEITYHTTTELERKFLEHFSKLGITVEIKNRNIITPKEIDVYFSDILLGIEINGGYWHSDEFNTNKNKHLEKLNLAYSSNIELWQFWDWEVEEHWDLIISKIMYKLGKANKLFARKLKLKNVANTQKTEFLELNHIQGDCPSSINIGLYEHDTLVMIGTFGKTRFSKKSKWELLRLASKNNTTVVGGASKIVSYFKNNFMLEGESLISYCHKRFSNGKVYLNSGFSFLHSSPPGYVYVKRGKYAGSRNQWQKHLLKDKLNLYDDNLSEVENMRANGYYRLWDCGQNVYRLTK